MLRRKGSNVRKLVAVNTEQAGNGWGLREWRGGLRESGIWANSWGRKSELCGWLLEELCRQMEQQMQKPWGHQGEKEASRQAREESERHRGGRGGPCLWQEAEVSLSISSASIKTTGYTRTNRRESPKRIVAMNHFYHLSVCWMAYDLLCDYMINLRRAGTMLSYSHLPS